MAPTYIQQLIKVSHKGRCLRSNTQSLLKVSTTVLIPPHEYRWIRVLGQLSLEIDDIQLLQLLNIINF